MPPSAPPAAAPSAPLPGKSAPFAALARHGERLPDQLAQRIPASDTRILRFLLHFLEGEGLAGVAIYINGGYIRDMLLGKVPDDLDLSLCLRGCEEEVSVGTLLERLP